MVAYNDPQFALVTKFRTKKNITNTRDWVTPKKTHSKSAQHNKQVLFRPNFSRAELALDKWLDPPMHTLD